MEEELPSEEEERVALLAALLHVEHQGDAAPARATASNGWKQAGRRALLHRRPQRAGGRS
jgi:hypothetical protein